LTPLPGLGAPEVNLGGDIDYGAIIDYVNNRDNNDSVTIPQRWQWFRWGGDPVG
jgi:hypothetical protein